MKIGFTLIGIFIGGQVFGQILFDNNSRKTDSLNNINYIKLKNSGHLNSNGLKTGTWVEYELLYDSTNGNSPVIVQREEFSLDMELKNPSTQLLKIEGNYLNGIRTQKFKWYEATYTYNDSLTWIVTRETDYVLGKKQGEEKEYVSGHLTHQASYLNNKLDGTETYYIPIDILYAKVQWENGIIKKATWYYPSEQVMTTKDYKKYPLTTITEYHENGKVKAKYKTLGDEELIDGLYNSFDEDGKLIEKKNYKKGIEVKK